MNTDSTRLSPPDRWSGIEQPGGGMELKDLGPKQSGDLAGRSVAEAAPNPKPSVDREQFKQAVIDSPRKVTVLDTELVSLNPLAERMMKHEIAVEDLSAQITNEKVKSGKDTKASEYLEKASACHRQAKQQLEKMMQAGEDADLAAAWNEAVGLSEHAAMYYGNAALDEQQHGHVTRNYSSIAEAEQKASQYLAKSIEDPTNATAWKKVASYTQQEAKFHLNSTKEASYYSAAAQAKKVSECLAKAIEEPEHAAEWTGKADESKKRLDLIIQTIVVGDELSEMNLKNYDSAISTKSKASEFLKKANDDPGNKALFEECAGYMQKAAEYYHKAVEEREKGNASNAEKYQACGLDSVFLPYFIQRRNNLNAIKSEVTDWHILSYIKDELKELNGTIPVIQDRIKEELHHISQSSASVAATT